MTKGRRRGCGVVPLAAAPVLPGRSFAQSFTTDEDGEPPAGRRLTGCSAIFDQPDDGSHGLPVR